MLVNAAYSFGGIRGPVQYPKRFKDLHQKGDKLTILLIIPVVAKRQCNDAIALLELRS